MEIVLCFVVENYLEKVILTNRSKNLFICNIQTLQLLKIFLKHALTDGDNFLKRNE